MHLMRLPAISVLGLALSEVFIPELPDYKFSAPEV
jgi:hypothetical protein